MKESFIEYLNEYPSAWKGHYLLAYDIVKTFRPNITVDLGVDYGHSTFALAYPKIGEVTGVDWFQGDIHTGIRDTAEIVLERYNWIKTEYGIDNIKFIKSDFDNLAKVWDKEINLLHIDGLHTYEAVENDFNTWSKFTNDNSIILFHDVESFKNTVGLFFDILDGYKFIHPGSAGLGIYTKSKENYNILKYLNRNLKDVSTIHKL